MLSGDESRVEVNVAAKSETKGNFLLNIIAFASRKKEQCDSIYEVEKPKVQTFKLKNDAATLGFACFLKKDDLGLELSSDQQSFVY